MSRDHEILNDFMVDIFYSILNKEEKDLEYLSNGKLTMREIHVIEAVFKTLKTKTNTFSGIASLLKISLGTLTESFNRLQKKGYLTKEQDQTDKRIFYIVPTPIAQMVNDEHTKWHKKLIDNIITTVPDEILADFIGAMQKLGEHLKKDP